MVKLNILTIIIIEINLLYCSIVLPLETLNHNQYLTGDKTFNDLISKELISPLYTKLQIGNQLIPLLIKPKTEVFLVNSYLRLNSTINIDKKFYNFTNDFSILFNETKLANNSLKNCTNCTVPNSLVKKIFTFNETLFYYDNINMTNPKKNISFDFFLGKNIKDNINGLIGLNLINGLDANFFKVLNNKNITKDYYWYYDFDIWNKSNGTLIIGLLPDELNKIDFTGSYPNYWEMKFYQVYFLNKTNDQINNTINFYYETALFNYDSNVIIGTNKYKTFLLLMLDELIKNGSCKDTFFTEFEDEFNTVKNSYTYYSCNYNNETLDKLNEVITTLYFYSKELNYTFEITKDEIIRIINNTIFINILFINDKTKENIWILGKPFIFKYKLIFNSLTKNIGFYNIDKYKQKNNNNNNNKIIKRANPKDKLYKLIIIIILLVYVCVGLILLTWKNMTNKNKEINNDEYKNIDEDKKDDSSIGILNQDDDDNNEEKAYKENDNKKNKEDIEDDQDNIN